jgi:hypothetical protein
VSGPQVISERYSTEDWGEREACVARNNRERELAQEGYKIVPSGIWLQEGEGIVDFLMLAVKRPEPIRIKPEEKSA